MKKVGELYRRMVGIFLAQEGKVAMRDIDRITEIEKPMEMEGIVKLRQAISSATTTLIATATRNGVRLPAGFYDHVMFDRKLPNYHVYLEEDNTILENENTVPAEIYEKIAFNTAKSLHDEIIKTSGKSMFGKNYVPDDPLKTSFDLDFRGDVCRFLPLEIAGLDEVKSCHAIIAPMLLVLGLGIRWLVVEEFYPEQSDKFLEESGIETGSDLVQAIMTGQKFYHAWPETIASVLRQNRGLAEQLATSAIFGSKLNIR